MGPTKKMQQNNDDEEKGPDNVAGNAATGEEEGGGGGKKGGFEVGSLGPQGQRRSGPSGRVDGDAGGFDAHASLSAALIGTLAAWAGMVASLDAEEDAHVCKVFNDALDDGHYPEHDRHRHCELRSTGQESLVSSESLAFKVVPGEWVGSTVPVGRGPGTAALSWTEARSFPKFHAAFRHPFEIGRPPC